MRTTNKVLLLAAILLNTGCSSNMYLTKRMDIQDLDRFQIDCANKEAQLRFLESQKTSRTDRMIAGFNGNWYDELEAKAAGKKTERSAVASGDYDSTIRAIQWRIKTHCPASRYEQQLTADANLHLLQSR